MTTSAATRAGVRVRGSCKAGHVTETVADKGRYTWEGPCSHEGCAERVKCKRIPKDQIPPPAADRDADSTRVVRVDSYDDTGSGRQDDPGGLGVADADPLELENAAGGGDSAAADSGPPDPLTDSGDRAGWLDRARQRRAARSAGRDRPYRHPLIGA